MALTHAPIKNFTGLVNTASETDTQLGNMRMLSNVVPSPPGSLSAALSWTPVYTALPKADGIYRIEDGGVQLLLATDLAEGFLDIKAISDEANGALSGRWDNAYLDIFGGSKTPHLSTVGNHVFAGNGVDPNAIYIDGKGPLTNPIPYNSGRYAKNKYPIPPCTSFVRGGDLSLYCTGNKEHPLRVWATEPINLLGDNAFGLASEEGSFVDILCGGATKVIGLSSFRGSIICHTDAGLVVLGKVDKDQAGTGWRISQAPTDSRVGAYSLRTLNPTGGRLPYYLGSDGQLYRNEVRAATSEYLEPGAEQTATWQSTGLWDETLKDLRHAFIAYNSTEHYVFVGVNADFQSRRRGHPYYLVKGRLFEGTPKEEPEVISGPHWFPRFVAMEAIPNSSHMVGVDEAGNFWTTDLRDLREDRKTIPYVLDLGAQSPRVLFYNNEEGDSDQADLITDDDGNIIADDRGHRALTVSPTFSIAYEDRATATGHSYMFPTGERIDGIIPDAADPGWMDNRTLAAAETAFNDLGSPQTTKQIYEVILNFAPGSVGQVGVFVEGDDGQHDGRWLGEIEDLDSTKAGVLVRGRKFRVRVYVVAELGACWTLQDLAVGYITETAL
jgi:hypothetical protein